MPHVDQWTLAGSGTCAYCGAKALVFPEPFGGEDACRPCWELICYGDESEPAPPNPEATGEPA
jgi:hypothetical protein